MDILKRSLAPITSQAWQAIENEAKSVLSNNLSARKFVEVMGPHGIDYVAVGLGRLEVPKKQIVEGVDYGLHKVQPLLEFRVFFELEIWELDNLVRGAKDVDLEPVTEAAKKAAKFEDQVIYQGFKPGNIVGLSQASEYKPVKLKLDGEAMLDGISKGILNLRDEAIDGPYTLVAGEKVWNALSKYSSGYPLRKHVERLIEGQIIYSSVVDTAYLVPSNAEDLQLILGQDLSIGYHSHDTKKVKLFITESFTFRVLEPRNVLHFEI